MCQTLLFDFSRVWFRDYRAYNSYQIHTGQVQILLVILFQYQHIIRFGYEKETAALRDDSNFCVQERSDAGIWAAEWPWSVTTRYWEWRGTPLIVIWRRHTDSWPWSTTQVIRHGRSVSSTIHTGGGENSARNSVEPYPLLHLCHNAGLVWFPDL